MGSHQRPRVERQAEQHPTRSSVRLAANRRAASLGRDTAANRRAAPWRWLVGLLSIVLLTAVACGATPANNAPFTATVPAATTAIGPAPAPGSPSPAASLSPQENARQVRAALTALPATPYEVVAAYPHDPDAFLQGLVWHEDGFYASTGLFGRSSLRRLDFPSGEVLQYQPLPGQYFGEGLALLDDRLVQLTWRAGLGFVYHRETFDLLHTFTYDTEGWGLTYDGEWLIMSDGSDVLTYLDPNTYAPVWHTPVTANGVPVHQLNELEWVDGEIWANVWYTDVVIRIDPWTGHVTSYLDFADLLPPDQRTGREDVLNGIAYDPATGRHFVTGKLWPLLFELRLTQ